MSYYPTINGVLRSARALDGRDQKKVLLVVVLQILLGVLDLVGVAIVGILGALAVTGVQSGKAGGRVQGALEALGLSSSSFQVQVGILGFLATTILVSRTIISALFVRKTFFFLSRRGAKISSDLISKVLSQSIVALNSRTNQETLYGITTGVTSITNGILGASVSLISDGSLLVVMTLGLVFVDPLMAGLTLIVFSTVGAILFKILHSKAANLGHQNAVLSIESNEKILEVLSSYRESVVRHRRAFYAKQIGDLRFKLANIEAELSFMPNVSKYVIESTIVLGALLISAVQFATHDAAHAVATLAVFMAAGSRIAPAVLRFQQGALQIRSSLGSSETTLKLIEEMKNVSKDHVGIDELDLHHDGFNPEVHLKDVTFSYPESARNAVQNIDISVAPGSSLALVGPSGAGKTTVVDILLGIIQPLRGQAEISGQSPSDAVATWPGAVAYVPQDIFISNGTIRENVALGYPTKDLSDDFIWNALRIAQLDEFVLNLPHGLDTQVGDRGAKISGGQRQRLGIARAMFTSPRLLVLDEATSALDGLTEAAISSAISVLKGHVTVILVAHRLSTVQSVDQVVYLSDGKILASGSFEEVRTNVPEFDTQAKLMGL